MPIAVKRNFTIPSTSAIGTSELYITSSAGSTSTGTGALQVSGGAGVSGDIVVGGTVKFINGNFFTAFDSAATASTTYYWPATSPASGSSVLSSDAAGNMSWILMSASGSGLTLNSLSSTTQFFATSISGFGFTIGSIGSTHTYYLALAGNASTGLVSSAGQTFFGLKTFASGVAITSTTGSGSTTTGALTVSGGIGIGGSLSVYQTTTVSDNILINSAKEVRFFNSGNTFYTGLKAGSLTTSTSFTLPLTDGTANQVLYTNGSAALGWTTVSAVSGSGITSLNSLTSTNQTFATSISGSGFTIGSSSSTHTFYLALAGSASTGLISSASQTLFGLKTFGSGIAITSGTASTNTTTGALTVNGGVGITGQLSVNTIALGVTGVTSTPTITFTGTAGTVITMSVQSDSTLAWEGSSGQLFAIDNNLSSGEIFSVSDISGLPLISASAGQTITLNEFGGYTQVGNGLASTSTTTGALRVVGGLGVTGNVAIGGTFIRSSWTVGETINTAMYNYSDLSMAGITTITSTTLTRIGNITYTPKSSSSYIWIEFHANYDFVDGSLGDDFWSSLAVNGTEIAAINQRMVNSAGGGTRSGTLFPISTRYTNSTTSGIAITVQAKRGTADDNIRVYGSSTSGYMRIQEIGR